jgi:nspC: carboxynorspermidine decarboxylase
LENFEEELLSELDGLHFHTLCEQGADALEITLKAVEEKFGKYLYQMKWLNLGGGHHITKADYDVDALIRMVRHLKETYDVEVYLEPGEAVVLDAGFLVSQVLEVVHNGMDIAILDTSAACHMPDVLEMPYRPPVKDSGLAGEKLVQ